MKEFDYGNGDDYEPSIKVLPKQDSNSQAAQGNNKILRPRYASTELGTKEKLFVGVLTSRDTIDSLGVAINKTLTHYVPKLVFFMDTRGPSLPGGMAVVSFSDEKPNLRPFHMLKYLAAHYAHVYDYYMFLPDTTYVRGEKVLDLVSHISIRYVTVLRTLNVLFVFGVSVLGWSGRGVPEKNRTRRQSPNLPNSVS